MLLKASLEEGSCDFARYMCLPYRARNEIGYGKIGCGQIKQGKNVLQFPHMRAERLPPKRKPRLCFPQETM